MCKENKNHDLILQFFSSKSPSSAIMESTTLQSPVECICIPLLVNKAPSMEYFTDVLTTFLCLGTFQLHCRLCRVRKLSDFIKNICVLKMNEGLSDLEQHEGE